MITFNRRNAYVCDIEIVGDPLRCLSEENFRIGHTRFESSHRTRSRRGCPPTHISGELALARKLHLAGCSAAKHLCDDLEEGPTLNRLRQETNSAQRQRFVGKLVKGRADDDRRHGRWKVATQVNEEIEAIRLRHRNVRQNQVQVTTPRLIQPGLPICRYRYVITASVEEHLK
jgi:hypothetical protein